MYLNKKIVVLGAGGFAREVGLVIQSYYNHPIDAYLSDDEKQWGKKYEFGYCLGSIDTFNDFAEHGIFFAPGIGSPVIRKYLSERALRRGWEPMYTLSHKAHYPENWAEAKLSISAGAVICSGVSMTVNTTIGPFVNVNLNCTLGHDCVLEAYTNLSPGVSISGFTHLEKGVDVGVGAVILPKVRVGKGSIIGAGAVIIEDVPPYSVVVGVPGKVIKTLDPSDPRYFKD